MEHLTLVLTFQKSLCLSFPLLRNDEIVDIIWWGIVSYYFSSFTALFYLCLLEWICRGCVFKFWFLLFPFTLPLLVLYYLNLPGGLSSLRVRFIAAIYRWDSWSVPRPPSPPALIYCLVHLCGTYVPNKVQIQWVWRYWLRGKFSLYRFVKLRASILK